MCSCWRCRAGLPHISPTERVDELRLWHDTLDRVRCELVEAGVVAPEKRRWLSDPDGADLDVEIEMRVNRIRGHSALSPAVREAFWCGELHPDMFVAEALRAFEVHR